MTLALTPAQAKSLMNLLNKAIATYEETFGKVEFPTQFLEPQKVFNGVGVLPVAASDNTPKK